MALRAGILAFALFYLALGAVMVLDPHDFYVNVGPFGPRNDHYARDVASYNLALGALLLISWRRAPGWRAPLLAFAAIQFTLHALNHLYDIDAAHPHWVGVADFVELTAGTLLLAFLAQRARQDVAR